MSKKTKKYFGFTLIELLVAVTVMGIIGIMVMAVLTESRARSRDSRRVSDIKTMHEALAMYLSGHNYFPVETTEIIINGTDSVSNALRLEGILLSGLADPNAGQSIDGEIFNYYYQTNTQGTSYTLRYCQETNSIHGQAQGCGNTVTQ